jgi:hypothetical protein
MMRGGHGGGHGGHHGGRFEEEMSRFEAEINVARTQAFLIAAAGGGGGAQIAPPVGLYHPAMQATPAVISAPPSNSAGQVVISAPPSRPATAAADDDIMATLQKYEKQARNETTSKPAATPKMMVPTKTKANLTALAKDVANKKAKMLADSAKKTALANAVPAPGGSAAASTSSGSAKTPTSVTISDETVKKVFLPAALTSGSILCFVVVRAHHAAGLFNPNPMKKKMLLILDTLESSM